MLERDFLYHYLSKVPFEPRYRQATKPTKRVRPQRELFKEACAILKTVLEREAKENAANAYVDEDSDDDVDGDAETVVKVDADVGARAETEAEATVGVEVDGDEDDDHISTTISEQSSYTAAPPQVFSVPTTSRELAIADQDFVWSKRPRHTQLTSTLPHSTRALEAKYLLPKGMAVDLEHSSFLSEFDYDYYWGPAPMQPLHVTPQLADSIQARLMQRSSETSAMLSRLAESPVSNKSRKKSVKSDKPALSKAKSGLKELPDVAVDNDLLSAPPPFEFSRLEGFGKEGAFDNTFLPVAAGPSVSSSSTSCGSSTQTGASANAWEAGCLDEQLSSFYAL